LSLALSIYMSLILFTCLSLISRSFVEAHSLFVLLSLALSLFSGSCGLLFSLCFSVCRNSLSCCVVLFPSLALDRSFSIAISLAHSLAFSLSRSLFRWIFEPRSIFLPLCVCVALVVTQTHKQTQTKFPVLSLRSSVRSFSLFFFDLALSLSCSRAPAFSNFLCLLFAFSLFTPSLPHSHFSFFLSLSHFFLHVRFIVKNI